MEVSLMPWPLYPWGKSPEYPLDRRLGGSQGQSGHGKKRGKNPYVVPARN